MNSNVGTTRLDASSCGCEIAWLYKDAHRYGLEQYKELIDGMTGGNNVNCPEGPVLTTSNTEFIARMEACPGILVRIIICLDGLISFIVILIF